MIVGARWQELARLVVELGSDVSMAPVGDRWDSARWDQGRWVNTWDPYWTDITAQVERAHLTPGLTALDAPAVAAVASLTVWDPDGRMSPPEHQWGMGRLIRLTVIPAGGVPVVLFTGTVQSTGASGTAAHPTTDVSAVDALATIGRPNLATPYFTTEATELARVTGLLDYVNWPTNRRDVQSLGDVLLPEPANQWADVLANTAASTGALYWIDATTDTFRYQTRDALGIYAHEPIALAFLCGTPDDTVAPGVPIVVPVSLDAVAAYSGVENVVTMANTAAAKVTAEDRESITHYGIAPGGSSGLTTKSAVTLGELAARRLAMYAEPRPVVQPIDVQVYDVDTLAAALLAFPARVSVTWNTAREWASPAFVLGVEHDWTADAWTASVTLAEHEPTWPEPPPVAGYGPWYPMGSDLVLSDSGTQALDAVDRSPLGLRLRPLATPPPVAGWGSPSTLALAPRSDADYRMATPLPYVADGVTAMTVAGVARLGDPSGGSWYDGVSPNPGRVQLGRNPNTNELMMYAGKFPFLISAPNVTANGQGFYYCAIYDGPRTRLWLASEATVGLAPVLVIGPGDAGPDIPEVFGFLGEYSGDVGSRFQDRHGELVLWPRALTDPEAATIIRWLTSRWPNI